MTFFILTQQVNCNKRGNKQDGGRADTCARRNVRLQ